MYNNIDTTTSAVEIVNRILISLIKDCILLEVPKVLYKAHKNIKYSDLKFNVGGGCL